MFDWFKEFFRGEDEIHVGDHVSFEVDGKEVIGGVHMILVDQVSGEQIALVEDLDTHGDLADRLYTFDIEDLELAA